MIEKKPSIYHNRDFMLLFSGKVISLLGDQIYAFALSWYILSVTKSGLKAGVFLFIDALSMAFVSLFGGAIADRYSRKAIMVWMDLIRGLLVAAAAILVAHGQLRMWMLYLSAGLLGSCGGIFNPAASAIIPNLVEDDGLPEALALNQFSWSFCAISGMLAGGILYDAIGIFAVFILNAASYLASGLLEACIALKPGPRMARAKLDSLGREGRRILGELRQGYRYVRGDRLLFSLTLLSAIYNTFVMPLGFVYIPYLFNVLLRAEPLQLSLATGTIFIGMMGASILVPAFLKKYRLRDALLWGLLVLALCQAILPLAIFTPLRAYFDNWGITCLMVGLSIPMGVAISFFNIPIGIILQKKTSDEYRGRFWGFFSCLSSLVIPLAYLGGGFLVQRAPIAFAFLGSSAAFLLLDLWVVNAREVRELGE
jgi:DHA3 family macrolide efflux protein-like MFS transporter